MVSSKTKLNGTKSPFKTWLTSFRPRKTMDICRLHFMTFFLHFLRLPL